MEKLYYVYILASAAKLVKLLAAEGLFSEFSRRLFSPAFVARGLFAARGESEAAML
jgi:hypothetical protein